MTDLFGDTSGWACAFIRSQQYHEIAVSTLDHCRKTRRRIITTNYVLAELAALLTSPLAISRLKQIAILESIRDSEFIDVVHVDQALDSAAFDLFRNRQDKLWSVADCASFVVMHQQTITEALTTDKHFEQAGFVPIWK